MTGNGRAERPWNGSGSLMFALLLLATVALAACNGGAPEQPRGAGAPGEQTRDQAERGRYLVDTSGCHDCHTPFKMGDRGPEPDMELALSGHPQQLEMPPPPRLQEPWMWVGAATNTAFAGPWGISYSINLTPDEQTGIGTWSEQTFINSIRTGRHLGVGRPVMPPMPWPAYANFTDEDLRAIFIYLRSVRPISNKVPEGQPSEQWPTS
jgi:hypothetical protein